jgi:type VI secretion system protein ImpK
LHALCLLLGYRGRFAFGDASEIHSILHRIREKINRIRGAYALFRPLETPAAPPRRKADSWVRGLAITAIVLAVFTLIAYLGYVLLLGQSMPTASNVMGQSIVANAESPSSLASGLPGVTL